MTDVFISYSRRDGEFARRLTNRLAQTQRDIWIDWEDIPLTADWWSEIKRGIEAAETFVFVVSPDSIESPICQMEVNHARTFNKRIIPIIRRQVDQQNAFAQLANRPLDDNTRAALGNLEILAIARDNWNAIARHNWIFFEDDAGFETNFDRLVTAVEADLDHVREHTQILLRALEWERKGKDNGLLLRGNRLNEAESWLSASLEKDPKPTSRHSEYVAASRRASNRTQRTLLTGVTTALMVTVVLAVLAFSQFQTAQRNADLASTNESEAFLQASAAAEQRDRAQNNESTAIAAGATSEFNASLAETNEAQALQQSTLAAQERNRAQNNEATADRRADEAQSLAWVASGRQALAEDNHALALPLLLQANSIEDASNDAQVALAQAAYASGIIWQFTHPDERATRNIALSPDGTLFLTGPFLFDVESHALLHTFYEEWGGVRGIAINPEGTRALAGLDDDTLQLWDIDQASPTFGETLLTLVGHTARVSSANFSPDGRTAYSGSWDNTIISWDIDENSANFGKIKRSFEGHNGFVDDIALSPDGTTLASASWDHTVILWDTATGEIIHRMQGHRNYIKHIANNGRYIVSGGSDESVIVWDAETGDALYVLSGHRYDIRDIAISPVDDIAVVADGDRNLLLWDLVDGQLLQVIDPDATNVNGIDFSRDGSWIVVNQFNGYVRYDIRPGNLVRTFDTGEAAISTTALSGDGTRLAGMTIFNEVTVWDIETGDVLSTFTAGDRPANQLILNTDGTRALVAYGDLIAQPSDSGEVVVWDIETGEALQTFEGMGAVATIALSPDETLLATGADLVRVWDMATGELIRELDVRYVESLAFRPDGTELLTAATFNGQAILWEIATGEVYWRYGESGISISAAGITPDGHGIASTASDGSIVIRARPSGMLRHTMGGYPYPRSISFSPDGTRMLTVNDAHIVIWDIDANQPLRVFEADYFRQARWGAFLPDGERYVTVGFDRIQLWRYDARPELITWTQENRSIHEWTCAEREVYQIEPYCETLERFPTLTAPMFTITPTSG